MDGGRRYWAFLSYSHEDRDWANWLHRALETYAIPKDLVGRSSPAGPTPGRLRPIFKDREELAASADLRERVQAALAASSALIVVCSPAAARSSWVDDEIVRFKTLRGEARVFAVIVAGTPGASRLKGREEEECFPTALRFHVDAAGGLTGERAEIVAADLRPAGDGRNLAKLKLVAGVLGVGLDELGRRDAHRRARRLTALTAGSMAGALAMGALALAALASRNEARAQRAQAEGLVAFMLGDLRKKLEPLGRLDVLDAVGQRAMAYYTAQAPHRLDDEALGQRARVLHMLGEIQEKRGNLQNALREFQEASTTTSELLARRPDDGDRVFNHAQSVYYVSEVADLRGQDQEALAEALEYKRLAEQLVSINPKRGDWWEEVADANSNLGTLSLKHRRMGQALDAFRQALEITQSLARESPRDHELAVELAQAYAWVSDAEIAVGENYAGIKDRLAERQIYARLIKAAPDDIAAAEDLVVNRTTLAEIYMRANRLSEAVAELTQSTREAERLMATDRGNTQFEGYAVKAFTALGQALLWRGSTLSARHADERATDLAEALVTKDPTVDAWNGVELGRARLLGIEIAAQASSDRRACRQALAPAAQEFQRLERLSTASPQNIGLATAAAEAALLDGDYQAASGLPDRARTAWSRSAKILHAVGRGDPVPIYDNSRAIMAEAFYRQKQLDASEMISKICSRSAIKIALPARALSYAW